MMALILAMVRVRRAQALTLALLTMFAVASAVAAPGFLRAVEAAVVAGQVATATPAERGFTIDAAVDNGDEDGTDVTAVGTALVATPGFTGVSATEYPTVGIDPDQRYPTRLVYRQQVCTHLTVVEGRCLAAEGEVVLGEHVARRLRLRPGDPISLGYASLGPNIANPVYLLAGEPKRLTVAGTYRVPEPDDPYWGTHGYFAADGARRPGEPAFVAEATIQAMDHGTERRSVDATAEPGTLTAGRLGEVRATLGEVRLRAANVGASVSVTSGIPELLDRIDAGRTSAGSIVPVVAVPLVLLACMVIFLAVGYGIEARRPELAAVALRGVRPWARWWLATGESLLAIAVGAVAGCIAGQLLVHVLAAWWFGDLAVAGSGPVPFRYATTVAVATASAAAGAAVLAALLAHRRQLMSPVTDLLRRTPAAVAGWAALTVEAVVGLLAVLSLGQLVLSGGDLTGVAALTPALLLLGSALLLARGLLPLVSRYGRRGLERGRLSLTLAGLQLSRRSGAPRLFAVLVTAVAVSAYAVCAVDVGAQGRGVEARLGTGAARVVTVAAVTRQELLAAVRATDPRGEYAMAVVRLPPGGPGQAPGLAVDSTRLAAVATWPSGDGMRSAAQVAQRLRPATTDPVVIRGRDVAIELTTAGLRTSNELSMSLLLSSPTGTFQVGFGKLSNGPSTHRQRVERCAVGCRLAGVLLTGGPRRAGTVTATVTLRTIRTGGPAGETVAGPRLADPERWRMPVHGSLAAVPDGLSITVDAPAGQAQGAWVRPADAPYPMQVVATGDVPDGTLAGLDAQATPATAVQRVPALPRLGVAGTLVDLEYADRLTADAGQALAPEVWLAASAPADVLVRLAGNGLVVTSDVEADQVHRQLARQGPALSLGFYLLAGLLAVVLAGGALVLAATVDRALRTADLSAVRAQGVDRRTVGRATLWTYPLLVLLAAVAGLVVAVLGWRATGWALPLSSGAHPHLPLPFWPRPLVLAGAWLAALVVLTGTALAVGHDLRRRID